MLNTSIETIFMRKMRELPSIVAWIFWLGWTGLFCILMLSPSAGTVKNLSGFFGGTEITDAVGHVILVGVDCFLLYILMIHYLPDTIARRYSIIVTLMIAIIVETAQLWIPSRGASMIDIAAAFIGVGIVWWIIRRNIVG